MRSYILASGAFIFFLLNISCKKFISIDPPKTQISGNTVFSSDNTAEAALSGIYSQMSGGSGNFFRGGNHGWSYLGGLTADELVSYSFNSNEEEFFHNAISPANAYLLSFIWGELYKNIFTANSIIEGLNSSSEVTIATKNEIMGETKFIRAFSYFYLVNLFGDVPMVLSTDYSTNSILPRTKVSSVYNQILSDLYDDTTLLNEDYSASFSERVRPNKYAAIALLSRVYLYNHMYSLAEQYATRVIGNSSLYSLTDLQSVFLKNSTEAIWQLMPVIPGINTQDGFYFILNGAPTNAALSTNILDSFENGDNRRSYWTDSIITATGTFYFPYKYKVQTGNDVSEYSMILRLAEQYLIRAEARAEQNNIDGALQDLNVIRNRAGLTPSMANDQESVIAAIIHERQCELFTEWGHRWLDLKRTGLADAILGTIKIPNWQAKDTLFPVPQSEISKDVNLTQNPGY